MTIPTYEYMFIKLTKRLLELLMCSYLFNIFSLL